MIKNIWQNFLIIPFLNALLLLNYFIGNLGGAIIALTIILKTITAPVGVSQLKTQTKRAELQEELDKLKEKHKDKQKLSKAQMELYKKNGISPASGCLPMVVQLVVFIALYRVFMSSLNNGIDTSVLYFDFLKNATINLNFLYLDISKPDPYYILPIIAGISQFLLSKSFMSKAKVDKELAKETAGKKDDMMANMQQQMLYVTPIMTIFIGIKLPSGLVLYWLVSTLYAYIQNIIIKKYFLKAN